MTKSDFILFSCLALIIFFLFTNKGNDSTLIQHSIDTVYSTPDTVLLVDTVFIPKLHALLDTVYLPDSSRIISASADTTFQKDSSNISVKYFFPPLNYFEIAADISQKIITQTKTILEVKEFDKPIPFYKDNWFYSSVVLFVLLVFSFLK